MKGNKNERKQEWKDKIKGWKTERISEWKDKRIKGYKYERI